jgi:hypothetical protein
VGALLLLETYYSHVSAISAWVLHCGLSLNA